MTSLVNPHDSDSDSDEPKSKKDQDRSSSAPLRSADSDPPPEGKEGGGTSGSLLPFPRGEGSLRDVLLDPVDDWPFGSPGNERCGSGSLGLVQKVTNRISRAPLLCGGWSCHSCASGKARHYLALYCARFWAWPVIYHAHMSAGSDEELDRLRKRLMQRARRRQGNSLVCRVRGHQLHMFSTVDPGCEVVEFTPMAPMAALATLREKALVCGRVDSVRGAGQWRDSESKVRVGLHTSIGVWPRALIDQTADEVSRNLEARGLSERDVAHAEFVALCVELLIDRVDGPRHCR